MVRTYDQTQPVRARWYRRSGNPEDPWVSRHHYPHMVLYGGARNTWNHNYLLSSGADVFIRKSNYKLLKILLINLHIKACKESEIFCERDRACLDKNVADVESCCTDGRTYCNATERCQPETDKCGS